MYTTSIYDELRQIERDVIEGERRLAEQEAPVIELKRQNQERPKQKPNLNGDVAIRIDNVSSHGCNPEITTPQWRQWCLRDFVYGSQEADEPSACAGLPLRATSLREAWADGAGHGLAHVAGGIWLSS